MFCMNCGQQLPDGAKYCLQCGTPQGAVSPTGTTQAETINLDGMHTFVPALCPSCNAHMKVDSSAKVARCDSCGTECLVQDAIKALTVRGNVQVGNATINITGTNTDSLLQRVEIMLSDGEFCEAKSKCEAILDSDPSNGKAYIYLLMASFNCRSRDELFKTMNPYIVNHKYFVRAMQFGDETLKQELSEYTRNIKYSNRDSTNTLKYGDWFCFGKDMNNQPIWWRVLNVQEKGVLLVSDKKELDDQIHKTEPFSFLDRQCVKWSDSKLRTYLNNVYFFRTFDTTERKIILPCTNLIDNTSDNVFVLSIYEESYYRKEESMPAKVELFNSRERISHALDRYISAEVYVEAHDDDVKMTSLYDNIYPAVWISRF